MDVPQRVGRRVSVARTAAGLSQRLLAEQLGITREYLARVETARQRFSVPLVVRAAQVLGVQPADLLRSHGKEARAMDHRLQPRTAREEAIAKAFGAASYNNALKDVLALMHGHDFEPTSAVRRRRLRDEAIDALDARDIRIARIAASATLRVCRERQRQKRKIPRKLTVAIRRLEFSVRAKVRPKRTARRRLGRRG